MKKLLLLLASLIGFGSAAQAQLQPGLGESYICIGPIALSCTAVSVSNPLPITGSFSATLSGFAPGSAYATPLAVTGTSGNVGLPTGTVVVVYNTGSVAAYTKLGTSNAVVATTADDQIAPGGSQAFTVGSNTFLAGITATGSTSLNISGGSGLGISTGGTGSGGGGGGGTSSTYGSAFPSTGTAIGLTDGTNMIALKGSATLGAFVDVTTLPALVAGTALIGKVGIDQTTAGTTNGVALVGVNSATALAGAGAVGAGSSRVAVGQDATTIAGSAPGTAGTASSNVLTVQGVASMTKLLVTPDSVALPANQSVNLSQVNGVTTSTGAGAVGAGSQRVGVAQDTSTIGGNAPANAGQAATGSGVPTGATYAGANSSGNLTGLIQADTSAAISISTGTTTQLVALSSGKKIYVTAWDVIAGGTGNITLEYGTGSNCGTGTTALTGAYNLTAQTGIAKGTGLAPVLIIPASNALCAVTSASVQMSGSVSYTQF